MKQYRSDGFSCVYFNGTSVGNIRLSNKQCASGTDSVFGGHGSGNVVFENVHYKKIGVFSNPVGINIQKNKS